MPFLINSGDVSYQKKKFFKQFALSQNRVLDNLRERHIFLTVQLDNQKCAMGHGALFDSVSWAHPAHLDQKANTALDLQYLSEISSFLIGQMTKKAFNSPVDFDAYLLEQGKIFTKSFEEKNGVFLPDTLCLMALTPFSVAFYAALEQLVQKNIYEEVFQGSFFDAFKNFYEQVFQEKYPSVHLTPFIEKKIPWLMTLDVNTPFEQLWQTICRYKPTQIKVKVDNNPAKIKTILSNVIKLAQENINVRFYFDGNRSFCSLEEFNGLFLTPLLKKMPDLSERIIGLEEISRNMLNEPLLCSEYPLFLDENASSVLNLKKAAQKKVGMAVKIVRPLSLICAQIVFCTANKLPLSVQDLTLSGNSYLANLGLYRYINTSIGMETNYHLFVGEHRLENYPLEFQNLFRVKEGFIWIKHMPQTVFLPADKNLFN